MTPAVFILALLALEAHLATPSPSVRAEMSPQAQEGARYDDVSPDAYLKSWRLMGPIPISPDASSSPDEDAQRQAFEADLLAACGGEQGLRFEREQICVVGGQEHAFRLFESETDTIDLNEALEGREYSVAYALAEVDAATPTTVLAALGSDDAVKVWLNGTLVHRNWVQRALEPDQDLLPLELRSGPNHILLKIQNGTQDWAFAFRALGPRSLEERLWRAARDGDVESIQTILTRGGDLDIDAAPRWGLTAWQVARVFGRADAAELLANRGAHTQAPVPPPEAVVDAMLSGLTAGRSPGAAVLVSRDGKVLFERGYGYASLENGVEITPETKFRIGSITKQFTAAAILRLQEQGKLSVDDPLSKYLPEFPRGDEVTLHHLLTHTSGMHSYTDKPEFPKAVTAPITTEELIRSIEKDPFDFDPGTRYAYCNSGYFLLGYVVEKVSGQPYADFLKEQFFEPLGMTSTGVHTSDATLDHEAEGYAQNGATLEKAPDWDMSWAGGAGALYSTVGDLARWNDAVFGGRVLSEGSLEAAWTPVSVGESSPADGEGYGYGWALGRFRGQREIQHGGGLAGFVSQLSRYPDEHLTVVVLANAAPPVPGLAPGEVARSIGQIYLADKMESRRTPQAIALAPEVLESYVGRYDYGNAVLTVTRDDDRLFAQLTGQPRFEIFAKSEDEFFWKVVDAEVTFVRDGTGRVTKALHRQGGASIEAPRIEERATVELPPETLDAYVGKYDYGQGQVILTVTREDGRLFAQLTGQPRFEIFPSSPTEFHWKAVEAKITFVTDATGRVTGGIHEQGGRRLDVPKLE